MADQIQSVSPVGTIGDPAPRGLWLQPLSPPNLWRRFWAWAFLGWKWDPMK